MDGYGEGVVRFIGLHNNDKTERIGIELYEPLGKNNGTVRVRYIIFVFVIWYFLLEYKHLFYIFYASEKSKQQHHRIIGSNNYIISSLLRSVLRTM